MYKSYLKCISLEMDKGREYFLSYLSTLLYLPVSLLIYFFLFRAFMHEESCVMTMGEVLNYYTIVLFLKSAFQHAMAEVYYVYQDINRGFLDVLITKPISYPMSRYCRALGSVCLTIPTSILLLVILFWGKYTFAAMLAFFMSVLLGFTLLFLVMFLLGSLTFWLKSVLTLRDIFWVVLCIFSGELIPLAFFPAQFRFLQNNPLVCIYDIPYRVLNGVSGLRMELLCFQLIHILLWGAIVTLVWNIGVKHYESQGG